MSFETVITDLKRELSVKHRTAKTKETTAAEANIRRLELITKIEGITLEILSSIANDQAPVLKTIDHVNWDNCFFDGRVKLKERRKIRSIDFGKQSSRGKFATIVFLLSKIYKLLTCQQTSTRRELYYENLHIFGSQRQVDSGMMDVCYILNAPTWELRVMTTSKGIVSGPLILKFADGELLDCSKKGGVSIPSNVVEIKEMSSTATWVLIIEKDTAFQKLITDEAPFKLGQCIFITGKGFPDVNTRILVCKFWEHLQIPVLALVDADPHGFEIMCIYRFGSLNMSSYSGRLACPAVRWLGVHPTDINNLLLDTKALSLRDVNKIRCLLQRSYVENNSNFKNQLETLMNGNVKAEIEGVFSISPNYLVDVYIKNKIQCKDYY